MADDEVRPGSEPLRSGPATPNRGKRRPAPTIDATAEDVSPVASEGGLSDVGPGEASDLPAEPAADVDASDDMSVREPSMAAGAADLAGSERPAEAFASSPARDELTAPRGEPTLPRGQPKPRGSMMPALLAGIGLILIVLLGVNLYTMYVPPGSNGLPTVDDKIMALDRRVVGLESKPQVAANLAPLDDRLKAVEALGAQLKIDLADTRQKLDALASPAAADTSLQPKLDDLAAHVASLQGIVAALPKPDLAKPDLGPIETRLGDLDQKVAALKGAVAALPKIDLAPLDAKVAGLETGIAAVRSTIAALPKIDLGPSEAKIESLDKRVAPLEAALSAPKMATQVTEARQAGSAAETRAAPLAVTAQAVTQAIDDGRPFPTEVAALQSLGTDESKLAPLKAVAAKGAPTKAELVEGFAAIRGKIVTVTAPAVTGTVLDRMMASATSFVKVRPAGAAPGDDPDAIASRIEADLAAGSFRVALDEWTRLPDAGKTASADWAGALKARVGAEDAARSIVSGAIAALSPTQ